MIRMDEDKRGNENDSKQMKLKKKKKIETSIEVSETNME